MLQTQPFRYAGVKHACYLLLISFFVFSTSFSQTTIFTTQTPLATTDNDHKPTVGHEVGVKFTSSAAGNISGIRFYKTSGNNGTHIGELYSSNGTRLAQATFVNETASGWQTVSFTSPVNITANTTYTAAYFSSLGNYTEDNDYFKGHSVINSSLTAPADGTNGASGGDPGNGQGVYAYSASPGFPNQLYKSANYWVDVIYSSVASIPVVANAGVNQIINVGTTPTLDGTGSTGTIFSYLWTEVSGGSAILTTPDQPTCPAVELFRGTYIFQLSVNGGASTSQVTITVNPPPPVPNAGPDQTIIAPISTVTLDGSGSTGIFSNSFWSQVSGPNTASITNQTDLITTATGLIPGVYVFDLNEDGFSNSKVKIIVLSTGGGTITNLFTTQTPVAGTGNDHRGTVGQEVGVKFTSAAPGTINGIRFYKTTGNAGTHIGELYTSAGIRLAQATFTNESASGWQQVSFSTPITITANTTYVAAYFSSLGNYVEDNDYFLHHTVTNAPLTAPDDGTNGASGTDPNVGQGTFKYSSTPTFPNQLYRSANYWVDVIFQSVRPSAVASAGPNQTIFLPQNSVTLDGTSSAGTITSYSWQLLAWANTNQIPVITNPHSAVTTVTGLGEGLYTFGLSVNNIIPAATVLITVGQIGESNIFTTQTPVATTDNDHQATVGHEVGVKFTSSSYGYINGIRFYKTSGNIGTHIGELYSSSGTRLAQATFTNESASGWQYVRFSSPIPIAFNTTYTAACFSSLGYYTEDNNYFLNHSVTNIPLTAPVDGTNGAGGIDPGTGQGVYLYTSTPAFPNQLFKSANYWVDVIFTGTPAQNAEPAKALEAKAVDSESGTTEKLSWFLGQNYPNPVPMSQNTRIEYRVPITSKVELILYDLQGRPVKIMVNEMKNAGRYSYDLNTGILAKGLYIYSLHSGTFHDVKKLVVQ